MQSANVEQWADALGSLAQMPVYQQSVVVQDGAVFFMGRREGIKFLGVVADALPADFSLTSQPITWRGRSLLLGLGELAPANAAALRHHLPFTAPRRIGLSKSVGLGDRLGIATPGHIRALRRHPGMAPVLAQQSIREMERTARTPQQVIDSASWGVFQEGWRQGYGADADHLKTGADIDLCAAAGFVMYTLDPRDHVDNDAETDSVATLRAKYERLPWERLESSAAACMASYAGRTCQLVGGRRLTLTEEHLLRAANKYGRALAHLVEQTRHLVQVMGARPFELEVSVDETEMPTRPEEHWYIASELKRLGVEWVSLAPCYVGRFEKGVDYIGDLDAFATSFAQHVAIACTLGPYKLSLHSGSDKFSIYPIAARAAGELVHLKTAGTSYLEALRAVATIDPALYREILAFAIDHYEADKASYHVSAELARVPDAAGISDADLPALLDQFDARQVFHVTFGTVLTVRDGQGASRFGERLMAALAADEEAHYGTLEAHIARHLAPFGA
jgi:hypothetical protein